MFTMSHEHYQKPAFSSPSLLQLYMGPMALGIFMH